MKTRGKRLAYGDFRGWQRGSAAAAELFTLS